MMSLKLRGDSISQSRLQAVPEPSSSRIVPKPVPSTQTSDPRTYHLDQVRRRFSPQEVTAGDGTTNLLFKLKPSDPDFPFELAYLECEMQVSAFYPDDLPILNVRNKNIPRGFSINIEKGWDRITRERKGAAILSMIHALDRELETILSEQKTETVKLVYFKDTRHLDASAAAELQTQQQPAAEKSAPKRYVPEQSYSRDQIAEARARRAQEIRQLEARMGRLPRFRRSADGVVFTLPIEPKRRNELPPGLHSVNSVHLIVPLMYPLQELRIQLNEADAADADPVEELFTQRAAAQKNMPIMSHLNYLVQNLPILAKQARTRAEQAEVEKEARTAQEVSSQAVSDSANQPIAEKPHVQYITRPPEWNSGDDDDDDDEDSSDDMDDEVGGASLGYEHRSQSGSMSQPTETIEKGTMMSFPSIELHGIEVLQVSILNIGVKCTRCKATKDFTGLQPSIEKAASCDKCAMPLIAKFNQTLVHENSARAGFLDLSGCRVADMLPSTFVPTCGRCSAAGQGLTAVRGDSVVNVCRECHGRFSFTMPQVKFLLVSEARTTEAAVTSGARRRTEKLGLHAGEPLPNKGSCSHYRKSFRWFRFSCCSRVYACDRCHDDAEDHDNEWAKRMICGWCSREQKYMVEACAFCGRSVIGNKGRGFWEGGKGTRDPTMMSRKDPRKYRRTGGG